MLLIKAANRFLKDLKLAKKRGYNIDKLEALLGDPQLGQRGRVSNVVNQLLAGEFFKRAIDGNTSAKTDVMDIMDSGVQQPVSEWKGMWVDWNMDTVLN